MTPARPPLIALVGAPNCGKTAMFNALTGAHQRVGNFSGVTVERKSGRAVTPGGHVLEVLDLPGTRSLRARSLDEQVTRDVVLGKEAGERRPDLLVAVLDATHPQASLRLVGELKRSGVPLLIVMNMIDLARHRGIGIDLDRLSWLIGAPVVAATAVRKAGMAALWDKLDAMLSHGLPQPQPPSWTEPGARELRAQTREANAIIAETYTTPERPHTASARVDAVLLHPVLGFVALLAILFLMFQAVFTGAEPFMTGIEWLLGRIGDGIGAVLPDGLVKSFLIEAILGGVGSVVAFLPQIVILFFFILMLEDVGYMGRAAFLMDRVMGGAGLHGRAFIPLLSSFACAIPGIMSARVIDSPRDRLTTILVAPLMTCSARIPVYTLIVGTFVPQTRVAGIFSLQGLVMFGLYVAGIIAALGVSFVLNRLVWRNEPSSPFLLDLPDYKIPQWRSILWGLWLRARAFLMRAGTIIFWMAIAMWFLNTSIRSVTD